MADNSIKTIYDCRGSLDLYENSNENTDQSIIEVVQKSESLLKVNKNNGNNKNNSLINDKNEYGISYVNVMDGVEIENDVDDKMHLKIIPNCYLHSYSWQLHDMLRFNPNTQDLIFMSDSGSEISQNLIRTVFKRKKVPKAKVNIFSQNLTLTPDNKVENNSENISKDKENSSEKCNNVCSKSSSNYGYSNEVIASSDKNLNNIGSSQITIIKNDESLNLSSNVPIGKNIYFDTSYGCNIKEEETVEETIFDAGDEINFENALMSDIDGNRKPFINSKYTVDDIHHINNVNKSSNVIHNVGSISQNENITPIMAFQNKELSDESEIFFNPLNIKELSKPNRNDIDENQYLQRDGHYNQASNIMDTSCVSLNSEVCGPLEMDDKNFYISNNQFPFKTNENNLSSNGIFNNNYIADILNDSISYNDINGLTHGIGSKDDSSHSGQKYISDSASNNINSIQTPMTKSQKSLQDEQNILKFMPDKISNYYKLFCSKKIPININECGNANPSQTGTNFVSSLFYGSVGDGKLFTCPTSLRISCFQSKAISLNTSFESSENQTEIESGLSSKCIENNEETENSYKKKAVSPNICIDDNLLNGDSYSSNSLSGNNTTSINEKPSVSGIRLIRTAKYGNAVKENTVIQSTLYKKTSLSLTCFDCIYRSPLYEYSEMALAYSDRNGYVTFIEDINSTKISSWNFYSQMTKTQKLSSPNVSSPSILKGNETLFFPTSQDGIINFDYSLLNNNSSQILQYAPQKITLFSSNTSNSPSIYKSTPFNALLFSQTHKGIYGVDNSALFYDFDLEKEAMREYFTIPNNTIANSISSHPKLPHILSMSCDNGCMYLFDNRTPMKKCLEFKMIGKYAMSSAFNDDYYLASGTENGYGMLFDIKNSQQSIMITVPESIRHNYIKTSDLYYKPSPANDSEFNCNIEAKYKYNLADCSFTKTVPELNYAAVADDAIRKVLFVNNKTPVFVHHKDSADLLNITTNDLYTIQLKEIMIKTILNYAGGIDDQMQIKLSDILSVCEKTCVFAADISLEDYFNSNYTNVFISKAKLMGYDKQKYDEAMIKINNIKKSIVNSFMQSGSPHILGTARGMEDDEIWFGTNFGIYGGKIQYKK